MVQNALSFGAKWVIVVRDFVLAFHVTITTDVEIFIQQLLAAIAVHINIRQLFHTKFTEEITRAVWVQRKRPGILPRVWLRIDSDFCPFVLFIVFLV